MVEFLQPRDERIRAGDLPVREGGQRAVLDLAECSNRCLDHRALLIHRAEVVVEDGLADHVERERAVPLLHVEARALASSLGELRDEVGVGIPKLGDHPLKVELVEAGRDRAPTLGPSLRVRGDEPLAHDVLEHHRELSLVIPLDVITEDMLGDHRVGRH